MSELEEELHWRDEDVDLPTCDFCDEFIDEDEESVELWKDVSQELGELSEVIVDSRRSAGTFAKVYQGTDIGRGFLGRSTGEISAILQAVDKNSSIEVESSDFVYEAHPSTRVIAESVDGWGEECATRKNHDKAGVIVRVEPEMPQATLQLHQYCYETLFED